MMQAIHLDFGAARRGAPWLGRALLGLAAAASVDQLKLKRENRSNGEIQAEMRLTLHRVKS